MNWYNNFKFKKKNATPGLDVYEISTGVDNISKLGHIEKWNNLKSAKKKIYFVFYFK